MTRALVVLCVAACGRSIDTFALSQTPVVTIDGVTPQLASTGTSVAVAAHADQAVKSCSATVAGQGASCVSATNTCTCTFLVGGTTPEGAISVVVSMQAGSGTGQAAATLQVDRQAPVMSQALVSIERQPMGAPRLAGVTDLVRRLFALVELGAFRMANAQ
jgi:hypothetical protein